MAVLEALPHVVRHYAGRNAEGKSVFLSIDNNDDHQHQELVNKSATSTITYSRYQYTSESNGEVYIDYTQENEPKSSIETATTCHTIDLAPGISTPMQKANTLNCTAVMEGTINLILDSGEESTLQRGDIIIIQESTIHKWINITSNGHLPAPARILVVPMVQPSINNTININNINDPYNTTETEKIWKKLGLPLPRRDSGVSNYSSDSGVGVGSDSERFAKFRENEYWGSEF